MTVIARLDRAIQRKALDSPVKPENDKQTKLCRHTNDRISKNVIPRPSSVLSTDGRKTDDRGIQGFFNLNTKDTQFLTR